ncbi:ATP-grasp domain-containing protein [Allorhizobium undicola]|uniref:ATP-grasp domain-containing protein n=1 Tax=Allorhizobium undicola TaxID=78527 RepID=UPI003D328C4C
MKVYVLSPRAAVLDAAQKAGVSLFPIGTQAELDKLSTRERHVLVSDPLDPIEVARALLDADVKTGSKDVVCIGFGDQTSQVAAMVNASLDLAGGRHASFIALERMRNKYRLRQILGSSSPLNVRYWLVDSFSEIEFLLQDSPAGLVVKPIDGSGSRGVTRVSSVEDIQKLTQGGRLLVEEYISGKEYSVEMLTWAGCHVPLVVTEKHIGGDSGLVETGQIQPARLRPETTQLMFEAAAKVLSLVDYRYGLSHIEFILHEGRPKLVEAHGRVGGDRIADLMQWSIGSSGFELVFRAYLNDGAEQVAPTGMQAAIEFVDLRNFQREDQVWLDTVQRIDGVKEAVILREPGCRSSIFQSSDRHAFVVLTSPSIDEKVQSIRAMEF